MNTKKDKTKINDVTYSKEALQCEIGEKLKLARENKNLSPEFIIKELKFSHTFLDALETGHWEMLPGEVYALGFLRQYAALLHLDVSEEIERIKSNAFELATPLTYPDAGISPSPKWVALAVVLFLAVIIIFNLSDSDDNQETQINAEVSEQNLTEENSTQAESQAVNPSLETTLDSYDEPVVDTYVELALDVSAEEAVIVEAEPTPESFQDSVIDSALTEEVMLNKKTYSFYAATDDVWLQVFESNTDQDPVLLREVLLKKGQSFSIIDTPAKLLLTAGNPLSLEILEGNSVLFAAGALGKKNRVLKLFPINP